jgi:hypothetical protein
LPDVSIEYKIMNGSIKEYIEVRKIPDATLKEQESVLFIWDWLATGLTPTIVNKEILFKNRNNVIFRYKPLYIYDSKGAILQGKYFIRGSKFGISISADQLQRAEFPIIIDPTTDSTTIFNTYYGEQQSGDDHIEAAYMKIQAPDMTGETVNSAELQIYCSATDTGTFAIFCDVVSLNWNESSTPVALAAMTFNAQVATGNSTPAAWMI